MSRFCYLASMHTAIVLAICSALYAAVPALGSPVDFEGPATERRETAAEFTDRLARAERAILAAYQLPELDPETHAAVQAFFDSAAEAFVQPEQERKFPSRATWRHAQSISPELIACDDPLVRLLLHEAAQNAWFSVPDLSMSKANIADDLRAVRDRGLPDERVAAIASALMYGPTNERKAITEVAMDSIVRAVNIPARDTFERRRIFNALFRATSNFGLALLDDLEARIDADPPEDPWIADAVIGARLNRLGWIHRGPLFNFRPREESMRVAAELFARARVRLVAAHERDPACPEPATAMMSVVLGGARTPGEHGRDWFRRAVEAEPDPSPALALMRNPMLRRWGGNPGQLREFALWCADPQRHATDAPIEAHQTLRVLANESSHAEAWSDRTLTEPVQTALEACIASNPPPLRRERAIHALIDLHLQAGDYPRGAALLREIGGEIDFWTRRSWLQHHTLYAPRLLPHDTPGRHSAALAESSESIGDWSSAVEFWNATLDAIDPDADPLGHRATTERLLHARRTERLATGEWVELDFPDGLTGFRVLHGRFVPIDESRVRLHREDWYFHGTAAGVFDLHVAGDYEVETTISSPISKAGILIGLIPSSPRNDHYVRVAALREDLHVEFSYRADQIKVKLPKRPFNSSVTLRVRVEGTDLTVFVDDEEVYKGPSPWRLLDRGRRIGIAAERMRSDGERGFAVEVSGYRVRQIAPPRVAPVPHEEPDDFFEF